MAAADPLVPLSRSANLELALYAAGDAVAQVRAGRSLSDALGRLEPGSSLGAAVQDLAYGTLRNLGMLDALLAELLRKPVKPALYALLLAALYQLRARPRGGSGSARGVAPRARGQGSCQCSTAQLSARSRHTRRTL